MAMYSIFCVGLDSFSPEQAKTLLTGVFEAASSSEPSLAIVTVNPEILLQARRDAKYRAIIASFSHRLIDGVGVVMALRLRGHRAARVTGRQLLSALLDIAEQKGLHVRFVLKRGGLTSAERAAVELARLYPRAKFSFEYGAYEITNNDSGAEIVIATLGAPEQEFWLAKNRSRFPQARVFLGVGGALDVLCKTVAAPPAFLARLGLEWLWRLVIQPKRFRRIIRAVLIFPLLALGEYIKKVKK